MLRILDTNENKFRDHLGKMVQQGYERDTLEKRINKVSNAEKEEKRKQKRKWV